MVRAVLGQANKSHASGNQNPSNKSNAIGSIRTGSLHADLLGEEDEASHWLKKKDSVLAKHAAAAGVLAQKETQVLKQGKVLKLNSSHEWVEKMVAVTQTQMTLATLADKEVDALQDYIPLHRIQKVSFTTLSHEESSMIIMEDAAAEAPAPLHHHHWSMGITHRHDSTGSAHGNSIMFEIHTSEDGNTAGRVYSFKTNSSEECAEWVALLSSQSERRKKEVRKQEIMQYYRAKASRIYEHGATQALVALLITVSFGANAYQAEFHPGTLHSSDAEVAQVYSTIDICLTSVFVVELSFNIFAHWFWAFVLDGWNLFDFVIVGLSVISLLVPSLPGLSFLRVLRAFRVLRLIRRFRSLKRIFDALVLSIIPVLNAFFIGVLITAIYTIIGVYLFAGQSYQDFGTFNRSLMTLFMSVATGAWPIERMPLIAENGFLDKVVFGYLVSFVLVVVWTCLQVVVAVLLDNFLAVTTDDKRAEAIREQQEQRQVGSPLEPLLKKLALNFDAPDDLRRDIETVFHMLDVDDSGSLSDTEMLAGFAKLKLTPKIGMTVDECKAIKTHTLACADDAELSLELFERLMLAQLRDFVQRSLHDAFVMTQGNPETESMVAAFKLALVPDARGGREAEAARDDEERRIGELEQQMAVLRTEVESVPQHVMALLSALQHDDTHHALPSSSSASRDATQHADPESMHDHDAVKQHRADPEALDIRSSASPNDAQANSVVAAANPSSSPKTRAGSVPVPVHHALPIGSRASRDATQKQHADPEPMHDLDAVKSDSAATTVDGAVHLFFPEHASVHYAQPNSGLAVANPHRSPKIRVGSVYVPVVLSTPRGTTQWQASTPRGTTQWQAAGGGQDEGVQKNAPALEHNGSTESNPRGDSSTNPVASAAEGEGSAAAEVWGGSSWLDAANPRNFIPW